MRMMQLAFPYTVLHAHNRVQTFHPSPSWMAVWIICFVSSNKKKLPSITTIKRQQVVRRTLGVQVYGLFSIWWSNPSHSTHVQLDDTWTFVRSNVSVHSPLSHSSIDVLKNEWQEGTWPRFEECTCIKPLASQSWPSTELGIKMARFSLLE